MTLIRPASYQVLITPLVGMNQYGTTQDVTYDVEIDDYIKDGGITTIKGDIDNGDFDFGVFTFDSINLTCINFDGKFSSQEDSRSLFKYTRDRARIKINFFNGESNTPYSSFEGLIDDRSTKTNFNKFEVKFKILSLTSIINKTKVPAGVILNASTTTSAIKILLQLPEILTVLDYNDANINPLDEYEIDNGSFFDNLSLKDALDYLMVISNSVMYVKKATNDIIVKSREFNSGNIVNLYGHGDLFGRENIISITDYNEGTQRAFNTVNIDNISATDQSFVDVNGDNQKNLDFGFITDDNKKAEIANNILNYWKVPKTELLVDVETSLVKEIDFFDLVSIDFPYRATPYDKNPLPLYGQAKYGQALYPRIFGNLKIRPNKAFKIIGKSENPKKLTTKIKLRQVGVTIDDGFFSKIGSFYGTAIYGLNSYQYDPNRVNPNYRSSYGAALYGTVHYGNVL